MKTSRTRTQKKIIPILVLAVVALCSAGVWAYYHFLSKPAVSGTETINYSQPSKEETTTGESIKNDSSSTGGSDQSPSPTVSTDGSLPSVGMEITASNQSNGYLSVRTLIQTITSSGTCTLTMSGPGSKSYTTTSGVQALPSTSTCAGFDIPTSSLSAGAWTLSISFANDSVKASTSKEITIQQ